MSSETKLKNGGIAMEKPIRSGKLKGYYIIDLNWSKKEQKQFLKQIKDSQRQN